MKLEECWGLPPLDDEVFSSWIDRTTLTARWTKRRAIIEGAISQKSGSSYFDPDYNIGGSEFQDCCRLAGVDPKSASAKFLTRADWVIPRIIRRSYCIKCIEDSIAECGLPTYKRAWGVVLMPLCSRHQTLLEDGEFSPKNSLNLALPLFKSHWSSMLSKVNSDARANLYPWIPLSSRVQSKMSANPRLMESTAVRVLAQLFLSRWLLFATAENQRDSRARKGSFYELSKPSADAMIHQDSISACATMRAKALCYVGLVLGLISDTELQEALGADAFLPSNLADVVFHLGKERRLYVVTASARRLRALIDEETPKTTIRFVEGLINELRI